MFGSTNSTTHFGCDGAFAKHDQINPLYTKSLLLFSQPYKVWEGYISNDNPMASSLSIDFWSAKVISFFLSHVGIEISVDYITRRSSNWINTQWGHDVRKLLLGVSNTG